MKMFHNLLFIINSDSSHWSHIGFKIKSSDERIIDIKPIHVRQPTKKGEQIIFMSAEINLKYKPKVSAEKNLILPGNESDELFTALKIYANLISVADICAVGLSGPTPSSGFIYESEEEKKFLDATNGFDATLGLQINFGGNYFKEIYQDQLLDRIEGVTFLATANSQTDNVARFHEYIRLFERAFGSATEELAKLLYDFLSHVKNFDYTYEEIQDWMVEKRHGATHADQRNNFIFSSDLNRDIERIKQAAYDVLFNKSNWHDKSTARRNLMTPKQGVTKEGMFIVQQKTSDEEILTIKEDGEAFYDTTIPENILNSKEFKDLTKWWVKWSPPAHYKTEN